MNRNFKTIDQHRKEFKLFADTNGSFEGTTTVRLWKDGPDYIQWLNWNPHDPTISMDGEFSLNQLRALVLHLEEFRQK